MIENIVIENICNIIFAILLNQNIFIKYNMTNKKTFKKHYLGGILQNKKTAKNYLGGNKQNQNIPNILLPYLKKNFQHKDFQIINLCFLFENYILQQFWNYLSFNQKEHFLKRNDIADFFDYLLQNKSLPNDNSQLFDDFDNNTKLFVVPEFFNYYFYLDEPFENDDNDN